MKKILFPLSFLALFLVASPVKAWTINDGDLIKGSQPAVYFFWENKRFAFPNEQVYFSWFDGFSGIKNVTDTQLQNIPLSGNVAFRPGKALVKIQTDPKVYAISNGNTLRWIQTEAIARQLYGDSWAKQVKDVSDALFVNYQVGQPIANVGEYIVQDVLNQYYMGLSLSLFDRKLVSSSAKTFLLPSQTTINAPDQQNGYSANSTLGLDKLIAWYKNNMDDGNLLYENSMAAQGSTIKFLNFGNLFSGSFKHRSVIITDANSGNQKIEYGEAIFPSGFIAYPRAVVGNNYAVNEQTATYSFVTADQPDSVVKWYQDNAQKNGWTVTDYQKGSQSGGWSLTLKSVDGRKQIVIKWGTGTSNLATQFQVTYSAQ